MVARPTVVDQGTQTEDPNRADPKAPVNNGQLQRHEDSAGDTATWLYRLVFEDRVETRGSEASLELAPATEHTSAQGRVINRLLLRWTNLSTGEIQSTDEGHVEADQFENQLQDCLESLLTQGSDSDSDTNRPPARTRQPASPVTTRGTQPDGETGRKSQKPLPNPRKAQSRQRGPEAPEHQGRPDPVPPVDGSGVGPPQRQSRGHETPKQGVSSRPVSVATKDNKARAADSSKRDTAGNGASRPKKAQGVPKLTKSFTSTVSTAGEVPRSGPGKRQEQTPGPKQPRHGDTVYHSAGSQTRTPAAQFAPEHPATVVVASEVPTATEPIYLDPLLPLHQQEAPQGSLAWPQQEAPPGSLFWPQQEAPPGSLPWPVPFFHKVVIPPPRPAPPAFIQLPRPAPPAFIQLPRPASPTFIQLPRPASPTFIQLPRPASPTFIQLPRQASPEPVFFTI